MPGQHAGDGHAGEGRCEPVSLEGPHQRIDPQNLLRAAMYQGNLGKHVMMLNTHYIHARATRANLDFLDEGLVVWVGLGMPVVVLVISMRRQRSQAGTGSPESTHTRGQAEHRVSAAVGKRQTTVTNPTFARPALTRPLTGALVAPAEG